MRYHLKNTDGSQSASWGNANKSPPTTISEIKNGITPLYISPIGTFVMFFTTNTQTATGGITTPTATVMANYNAKPYRIKTQFLYCR